MTRGVRRHWKPCGRIVALKQCSGAVFTITTAEAARMLAEALRAHGRGDLDLEAMRRKVATVAHRLRGICSRCAAEDDRAAGVEPLPTEAPPAPTGGVS